MSVAAKIKSSLHTEKHRQLIRQEHHEFLVLTWKNCANACSMRWLWLAIGVGIGMFFAKSVVNYFKRLLNGFVRVLRKEI